MNRSTIRERLTHSITMSVYAQDSDEWASGRYSEAAVDKPWRDAGVLLRMSTPVKFSTHCSARAIPRHCHDNYELMYVFSGEITHRFDGETIKMSEGDLLVIVPGEYHSIDARDDDVIAVNIICEKPFMEGELSGLIATCTPVTELISPNSGAKHLHMPSRGSAEARTLAELLICEFLDPDVSSVNLIKCHLASLLNALHRVFGANDGHVYQINDDGRGDISYILTYIQNNFATVTLAQLAKVFGYDNYYLSKVIRKSTGATFIDLKHYFCIEEAKRLLKTTPLTVREVSERVGFSNMSYFYRMFAASCGSTPAEYRTREEI